VASTCWRWLVPPPGKDVTIQRCSVSILTIWLLVVNARSTPALIVVGVFEMYQGHCKDEVHTHTPATNNAPLIRMRNELWLLKS
jgi:hypothetical protein